jgi:hypothetical protein
MDTDKTPDPIDLPADLDTADGSAEPGVEDTGDDGSEASS